MDLVNQKLMCFSILIVSITFVFAQGISNNYLVLSAEGSQSLMNKVPKVIPIQDNSENDKEESEDARQYLPVVVMKGAVLAMKLGTFQLD